MTHRKLLQLPQWAPIVCLALLLLLIVWLWNVIPAIRNGRPDSCNEGSPTALAKDDDAR